jgi:hypothetical protein
MVTPTMLLKCTGTHINKGHLLLKDDKSFYNITSNVKCEELILGKDQGGLGIDILRARQKSADQ